MLLEHVGSQAEAVALAQDLLSTFRAPLMLGGRELSTSLSIGVALGGSGQLSSEDLLRQADLALYSAKADGRGTYAVFEPALETLAAERLEIENDLRQALAKRELWLAYQPIFNLENGTVGEVEALLRWERPRQGAMSPAVFIPVAEETGLIVPIGQWVLEQACNQVRAWHEQYPRLAGLVMSVNLSVRQFQHPGLVGDVARTLAETGIDPKALKLEITESVLMQDVEAAVQTCIALKALGVQLAIDDFGTGYSSLAQLKRLPFDTLKIDRSFVDGLGRDEQDMAIVRSVVTLANTLRLSVTAEGIESPTQEAHLRSLGCQRGQGFLFARPQRSEMLAGLLAEEHAPRQLRAA